MIQLYQEPGSNMVEAIVTQKLTDDDYDQFIPILEETIRQQGKVRLLWEMRKFSGWKPTALFRDAKFDVKHATDFEKVAMVGEKEWQDWMTSLMKPFTSAEVLFFDKEELTTAKSWLKS